MIGFRAMCEVLGESPQALQVTETLLVNNSFIAGELPKTGPYIYALVNDEKDIGQQTFLDVETMIKLRDWLTNQIDNAK